MSTPYETTGRAAQKERTRQALLAAARALIADGEAPTVDAAAAAASVSRATAYRYFANQRALLLAAHPEVAAASMLDADAPTDPASRLDSVIVNFTAMLVDTEVQQRAMLRLSLADDPSERGELPLRQGRAIGWIAEALEDLRGELTDDELRLLAVSIRATTGIEAMVWLIDVAGLTREQAVELMRWSAQALLRRAVEDHDPPRLGAAGAPGGPR